MNFDQTPALSAHSPSEETRVPYLPLPSHSPQQPASQPSDAAVDLASEKIAFTPGELLAQTASALERRGASLPPPTAAHTPDILTGTIGDTRTGVQMVKHPTLRGKLLIYLALISLVVFGGVGIAGVAVHGRLYPYGGTLVFSDPLRDNSQGHHWIVGSDNYGGNCEFTGGAYHISDSINSPYAYRCGTATDFSNFAFEAQMTILKGDAGGVYFRLNPTNDKDYELLVSQDGKYGLWRDDSSSSFQTLVGWTPNSVINRGLGQTNLIAVVANGNTITAYVNNVKVASVTDSTYSHGRIWFVANPLAKGGHSTEVAFSNAKMWKF
jgi:hypothetical protein